MKACSSVRNLWKHAVKVSYLQAYVCGSELITENNSYVSYSTETVGFARLKAVVGIILKARLSGCNTASTGN
jgi:hypothetical protein